MLFIPDWLAIRDFIEVDGDPAFAPTGAGVSRLTIGPDVLVLFAPPSPEGVPGFAVPGAIASSPVDLPSPCKGHQAVNMKLI